MVGKSVEWCAEPVVLGRGQPIVCEHGFDLGGDRSFGVLRGMSCLIGLLDLSLQMGFLLLVLVLVLLLLLLAVVVIAAG